MLSGVCLRLSNFPQFSFIQYMEVCVSAYGCWCPKKQETRTAIIPKYSDLEGEVLIPTV